MGNGPSTQRSAKDDSSTQRNASIQQRNAKKAGAVITAARWNAAGKAEARSGRPWVVTQTALPSVDSRKASDEPQLWHTIDTARATAATLTCTWSGQGNGKTKGMVFARKAGGGQWVPLSTSKAPHDPARLSVAIPTEELGGKLEFAYRVGGGGGHSLSIESAAVEVHGAGRGGALSVGEIMFDTIDESAAEHANWLDSPYVPYDDGTYRQEFGKMRRSSQKLVGTTLIYPLLPLALPLALPYPFPTATLTLTPTTNQMGSRIDELRRLLEVNDLTRPQTRTRTRTRTLFLTRSTTRA